VVGWVERHGCAATREQAVQLEIVPPRTVTYHGVEFDDLDLAAVLERRADVVLVDELAHTSPDGRKRYEEVQQLRDAGIDVITTVNVANLLSVRDIAARITGAGALEGVADEVVRSGEVVVIDLPPEALRRRIADGQVYSTDAVGGALANYFRPSNLALLSKLARAWLEGSVDETFAFLAPRGGRTSEGPRRRVELGSGTRGDRASRGPRRGG
jgi:two-component system, OmpR family, sensor histidine kinase KdpD